MYPIHPTKKEKEDYKIFFESFQNVIPCSVCKKNYIRHLREHPVKNSLHNRRKLVYWVIDMHNMVNGEIGKKILSYDNVLKKYEEVYGKKINLDEVEKDTNPAEEDDVEEIWDTPKVDTIFRNTIPNIVISFLILFIICLIVYLYFSLR